MPTKKAHRCGRCGLRMGYAVWLSLQGHYPDCVSEQDHEWVPASTPRNKPNDL